MVHVNIVIFHCKCFTSVVFVYVVQVVKEQFCADTEIARADIPTSTWKQLNVKRNGNMHVSGQTQVRIVCGVQCGVQCVYT